MAPAIRGGIHHIASERPPRGLTITLNRRPDQHKGVPRPKALCRLGLGILELHVHLQEQCGKNQRHFHVGHAIVGAGWVNGKSRAIVWMHDDDLRPAQTRSGALGKGRESGVARLDGLTVLDPTLGDKIVGVFEILWVAVEGKVCDADFGLRRSKSLLW